MRILPETIKMTREITEALVKSGGRAADGGISLPFLGSMVFLAGNGHHVDIGSLYGASAIVAGLVKVQFNLEGTIYCIDPYDAEIRNATVRGGPELQGKVSATPEEFWKNVEQFGLKDRVKLIQKNSHPWPEELKDTVFASAYIDGEHAGDTPLNDFYNLRGRVTQYIGCDNYEESYPDVVAAMATGMQTDDWFLFYKNLAFVSLRRILPARIGDNAVSILQM